MEHHSRTALPAINSALVLASEQDRDAEWVAVLAATPPGIKDTVGEIVAAYRAEMAGEFYSVMLEDPHARHYLSNETVHTRLHTSLQRWMDTLFGGTHDQAQVMAALQRQVGEVHARAEIPVQLVSRGMRLLKMRLFDHLVRSELNRSDLVAAVEYISGLMDLAFAEMSSAYVRSHEQGARTDEMFRMVTAGQNVALERQRQLAALTEWENSVLRALATRADMLHIAPLRTSAFGLWIQHKAPLLFDEAAEIAGIGQHIERLDRTLLPLLANEQAQNPMSSQPVLLRDLLSTLEESRYLVNALFDRLTDLEAGRDVLTQLYNRRFLQTIMRRAMKLAMRHENTFAVLMLDVDHFKRVNDQHGHDMGDRVLQHVAALMVSHGRASDFFFRYGGEEFLAVINEVNEEQALAVAEKIRTRIEAADIGLGDGKTLRVTISIGAAMHDGHPDFQRLITRADDALYRAKQGGRNRVSLSEGDGA
jgi:diguanylate cyclase